MKKILLTLSIAITSVQISSAQCTVNIAPSPGHVQITTSQTLNAQGMVYWVCGGVTLDVNSSDGASFLLEEGVTLNINDSDGDAIHAKPNCIINNNSAEDIAVIGNPANLTLNNNGAGSLVVSTVCTTITYDYSLVGGAPCLGSVSLDEDHLQAITIYPNPIEKGRDMKLDGNLGQLSSISIYDLTGKRVLVQTQISDVIFTSNLESGVYLLRLTDGTTIETRKMEIQ